LLIFGFGWSLSHCFAFNWYSNIGINKDYEFDLRHEGQNAKEIGSFASKAYLFWYAEGEKGQFHRPFGT